MITPLSSLPGLLVLCARLTIPHLPLIPQIIPPRSSNPTPIPLYHRIGNALRHTPLPPTPTPARNKDGGHTFPRRCEKPRKAQPLAANAPLLIPLNPKPSPQTTPTRLRAPNPTDSRLRSPPGRSRSTRRRPPGGKRPGRLTHQLRTAAVLGRTGPGTAMRLRRRGTGEEMGRSFTQAGRSLVRWPRGGQRAEMTMMSAVDGVESGHWLSGGCEYTSSKTIMCRW
jgi:hypothetical protein